MVPESSQGGKQLPEIGRNRLRELKPEPVITQVQCNVCSTALREMNPRLQPAGEST